MLLICCCITLYIRILRLTNITLPEGHNTSLLVLQEKKAMCKILCTCQSCASFGQAQIQEWSLGKIQCLGQRALLLRADTETYFQKLKTVWKLHSISGEFKVQISWTGCNAEKYTIRGYFIKTYPDIWQHAVIAISGFIVWQKPGNDRTMYKAVRAEKAKFWILGCFSSTTRLNWSLTWQVMVQLLSLRLGLQTRLTSWPVLLL